MSPPKKITAATIELDQKILKLLSIAPHTSKELSMKVFRSPSAVNIRVKKLMEEDSRVIIQEVRKVKTGFGYSFSTVYRADIDTGEMKGTIYDRPKVAWHA